MFQVSQPSRSMWPHTVRRVVYVPPILPPTLSVWRCLCLEQQPLWQALALVSSWATRRQRRPQRYVQVLMCCSLNGTSAAVEASAMLSSTAYAQAQRAGVSKLQRYTCVVAHMLSLPAMPVMRQLDPSLCSCATHC